MVDTTVPTRNQIARLVGDDPAMIKALERLFIVANDLTPTEINTLTQLITDNAYATGASDNKADVATSSAIAAQVSANAAQITASTALADAALAQDTADLVATGPAPSEQRIDRLQDVRAFGAANGSILVYNATLGAWIPTVGASGSFVAGIQTVTVVNGIITSIV
jgi:hypothetical protein